MLGDNLKVSGTRAAARLVDRAAPSAFYLPDAEFRRFLNERRDSLGCSPGHAGAGASGARG